jgi:aspartyl-tRNA(Asn)/glutamyl-tRNA(Gln) amidotransferase subunit C
MKVTEKEVAYVADLANLDLTAEERVRMLRDLNSILEHIDTLSELDTSNVAPMAQVMAGTANAAEGASFAYSRRDDVLIPSLPHDAALQNAPEVNKDFFKVPKVIER